MLLTVKKTEVNQVDSLDGLSPSVPDPLSWVSKTDVTRYLRCPYTFWKLDRREIEFADTVSPFAMDLIAEGIAFEDRVKAEATRVPMQTWWEEVWKGGVGLGAPILRNEDLRLYGRPDGLTSVGGVLHPIEIKSHKGVHVTDELELAFYWLLLQPYQKRVSKTPRGQLILRSRGGSAETVDLALPASRLDDVREIIENVRGARVNGVEPRVCACAWCRVDPEVARLVEERHHVSLIYGVGWVYSDALAELGITSYEELLDADAATLSEGMCDLGYRSVTLDEVTRWRHHAESYIRSEPIFFGSPFPVGEDFIALDAEYDDDEVWLVGLCVSRRGRLRYTTIWGDNAQEQRQGVETLLAFLDRHPDLPVVSWAGKSADVPALRRHLVRLKMEPERLQPLIERHIDAFDYTWRSLRFPAPWLTLKDVEQFLGIERPARDVLDGLDAIAMYRRYRRLPAQSAKKKAALREQLISYNRDDLRGVVKMTERLRRYPGVTGSDG